MVISMNIKKIAVARAVIHHARNIGRFRTGLLHAESDWFIDFAKEWGVARNIPKPKTHATASERREQLHDVWEQVKARLERSGYAPDARGVADFAAWLHMKFTSGNPLSLASKILYFRFPGKVVPLDRRAEAGLKLVLEREGMKASAGERYEKHLSDFNSLFSGMRDELGAVTTVNWAKAMTKGLGVDDSLLAKPMFLRKVLDNCLMTEGGRRI